MSKFAQKFEQPHSSHSIILSNSIIFEIFIHNRSFLLIFMKFNDYLIKNHILHEYTPKSNGKILDCISWLSFGCDGNNSLFDIQEMSGLPIDDLIYSLDILKKNKLIL